jgi:hypothetical protein
VIDDWRLRRCDLRLADIEALVRAESAAQIFAC